MDFTRHYPKAAGINDAFPSFFAPLIGLAKEKNVQVPDSSDGIKHKYFLIHFYGSFIMF